MNMKVTRYFIGLLFAFALALTPTNASGKEIVIAIDSSASIGHHINYIIDGVEIGLRALPEGYTVSVVVWNTFGMQPLVLHQSPQEASEALSEMTLVATGKTNLGEALIESFHMFETDEKYKTILVISDGISNASISPDLISQEISLFNKIEISAISIARFSLDVYRETVIYGPGSQALYAISVADIANSVTEILE